MDYRKLLVLARFGKRTHAELAPKELTTVALTCPRCAKCDYDLTGITGDKCPECGTALSSR